jgi:NitT/TauT family transport system ATP-binding protein
LLKIIAGLITPTDGRIDVSGQPLQDKRGPDRSRLGELGMVFQSPNLFPWFSIEENIALPLRLRGVDKPTRRDRVRQLCELLGIAGFEHSWPRELSGGMQQRAAIARALSYEPEILLADEPFGALDALTRDQLNLELQRIQSETGCTVLFVTHSISEAVFLADRIVLLSPRPGAIDIVVEVDFGRPRDLDLQSTPEFQRIVTQLRHRLDNFST